MKNLIFTHKSKLYILYILQYAYIFVNKNQQFCIIKNIIPQ